MKHRFIKKVTAAAAALLLLFSLVPMTALAAPGGVSVTFDHDNGTGMTTQGFTNAQGLIEEIPEPEFWGGHLIGWYRDREKTQPWDFGNDAATAPLTLYAKWELRSSGSLRVYLNYEGGTGEETMYFTGPGEIGQIPQATRENYDLLGWSLDPYGAELIDSHTTLYQDAVLYARWQEHLYTLRFDTGGNGTVPAQQLPYGSLATQPTDPSRPNYTFDGWYLEPTWQTQWDFNQNTITEDTTLYARWRGVTRVVEFETNGGSILVPLLVSHGSKLPVDLEQPTRDGYDFAGWYKDPALGQPWDFANDTVLSDITLYAKWAANLMTVHFETNGGTEISPQMVEFGGLVLRPTDPLRTGYNFDGWYKDPGFSEAWDFTLDAVKAPTTLYAKWTAKNYSVTFNSNGGTAVNNQVVAYSGTATEPPQPTKHGFRFAGWYDSPALTTLWDFGQNQIFASTTLYAKWDNSQFTVNFETNGGNSIPSQIVMEEDLVLRPSDPLKSGANFAGWYLDPSFSLSWDFNSSRVLGDMTLYAKWVMADVTVTFDSVGGSAVPSQTVMVGSYVTRPADPVRPGYVFTGWFFDSGYTMPWNFNGDLVTQNMTLYASWASGAMEMEPDSLTQVIPDQSTPMASPAVAVQPQQKITFHTEGGQFEQGETQLVVWTPAGDTLHTQLPKNPTRPVDGNKQLPYIFMGWAEGSPQGPLYSFGDQPITQDLELYATWIGGERMTGNVFFNSMGGHAVAPQMLVPLGDTGGAMADPVKPGYVFTGWYTQPTGGARVSLPVTVTGQTLLFAQWKAQTYQVGFDSQGGSAVASQQVAPGSLVTKPADPTRSGYTFQGWQWQGRVWDFAADRVNQDLTLTASWKKAEPPASSSSTPPSSSSSAPSSSSTAPSSSSAVSSSSSTASSSSSTASSSSASSSRSASSSSSTASSSASSSSASRGGDSSSQAPPASSQSGSQGGGGNRPPAETVAEQQRQETLAQLQEAGTPTVTLGGSEVPLFSFGGAKVWALANLMMALSGLVLALVMVVQYLRRRRQNLPPVLFTLLSAVAGAVLVILFLVTQDLRNLMVFLDKWSLFMLIVLAGQILLCVLGVRKAKEESYE